MADFSVIKEADAPRPSRPRGRLTARMAEYEGYVLGLRKGQVGKLVPGVGETSRGEAMRVSRAAKRVDRSANTWIVNGVVYFSAT